MLTQVKKLKKAKSWPMITLTLEILSLNDVTRPNYTYDKVSEKFDKGLLSNREFKKWLPPPEKGLLCLTQHLWARQKRKWSENLFN